jgi:hypothetical protein
MRYTDFPIFATDAQVVKSEGRKRVTFRLDVPGVLRAPVSCELDVRAARELKDKASIPEATWEDARALGEALAQALLPPQLRDALDNRITQAQAAAEGVRVRLMLRGSELDNWPWEFVLFNRGGGEAKSSDFLALMPNVSVVRQVATTLPAWRVEAKLPATLCVAIANPGGKWPNLKVADERDIVARAVAGCAQIALRTVEHARRGELPDKARPAHIFHFAGHGQFETEQSQTPGAFEGKGSVVLEDEYGDADVCPADALAIQLRDAGVRVAVLGACLTAQRDDTGAWSSVAESLLKAELGAVVAMQFPVLDKTGVAFAEKFYKTLAIGLSIDEAMSAARVAVAVSGDARGWATPVLHLRAPDGVIFTEFAADPKLQKARVDALQEIEVLRGKAVNVDAGTVRSGEIHATQRIDTVGADATAINVKVGEMTGGVVTSRQKVREVSGDITGVKLESFSVPAEPPVFRGGPTPHVDSKTEVGTMSGGQAIGTQINNRGGDTVINNYFEPSAAPHTASIEEKLRLDVGVPKTVVIDDPFELRVAVMQPDAPTFAVADSDQVVSADGSVFRHEEDDVVQYRVEVHGAGFEIPKSSYVFKLRPGVSSRPVAFEVTAKQVGKRRLYVEAYQMDDSLAAQTAINLEVAVAVKPGG